MKAKFVNEVQEVEIILDALNKYHGPIGGFERIKD